MTGQFGTGAVIRRAVVIFVPLALIAWSVLYYLYAQQVTSSRKIIANDQATSVEIARQRVAATINTIKSDVAYLGHQEVLRQWQAAQTPATVQALEREYLSFAENRRLYDQVRLIDARGREVVRVDAAGGGYKLVPPDRLQDKSDRYYVTDTLKLSPQEVYVSPFDLNIEGQKVETPYKPMIRVAVPIFDENGATGGLVILNYLGQRLLDRIRPLKGKLAGGNDVWLANDQGYWLIGPHPEQEWSFMFPGQPQYTFGQNYPAAWQQARGKSGQAHQFWADGDFFTVMGISLSLLRMDETGPAIDAKPTWYLISHMSNSAMMAQTAESRKNHILAAIAFTLLLAGGALGIAYYQMQRRQAEKQLWSRETQFRHLVEAAPDAIVVTDKSGKITLVNARAETMFGYDRQELIGQTVDILVPPRYHAAHQRHRDHYVAAPVPRAMGADLELYGQRRDGSEFPVAVSLSPAETDQGMMVFCDIRDVTKERRAEQEIADLNANLTRDNTELAALNKELETFSYSVSHDLRAPLRAIDGFSQALEEDYGDVLEDRAKQYLSRVRQATQRMDLLIDDMLELSRVARADVVKRNVDLSEMATDILKQLAEDGRQVDVRVQAVRPANADPRLIRIALENLLNNAWKFTRKTDAPRIEFGQIEEDGQVVYFVRDNGAGFDMAYAQRLFGAFQRLHDAKDYPGTGIGLATVQRVMAKHGGRIWAEAAPDRGATFYFML
ncbi:MAG: PAS domain-containing sensor histidine kinase [Rhodospirillaceae bacterium]|nr:MAG: PAS domain-containing sensor histidine kinase [Rhodospirillaceae bacterium]